MGICKNPGLWCNEEECQGVLWSAFVRGGVWGCGGRRIDFRVGDGMMERFNMSADSENAVGCGKEQKRE